MPKSDCQHETRVDVSQWPQHGEPFSIAGDYQRAFRYAHAWLDIVAPEVKPSDSLAGVLTQLDNATTRVLGIDTRTVSGRGRINEGDRVRLYSGGPEMTVVWRCDGNVGCIWEIETGLSAQTVFPVEAVRLSDEGLRLEILDRLDPATRNLIRAGRLTIDMSHGRVISKELLDDEAIDLSAVDRNIRLSLMNFLLDEIGKMLAREGAAVDANPAADRFFAGEIARARRENGKESVVRYSKPFYSDAGEVVHLVDLGQGGQAWADDSELHSFGTDRFAVIRPRSGLVQVIEIIPEACTFHSIIHEFEEGDGWAIEPCELAAALNRHHFDQLPAQVTPGKDEIPGFARENRGFQG